LTDYAREFDLFLQRLFPICRSITGEGNRETLHILNEIVPITQHEVSSGTQVYDWVIPEEWNIRNAWIATHDGRRIVDFQNNNLHVMSYSEPIESSMRWAELKSHLYTHSELPEAIPYRTTYYKRDWGFCITQPQYEELERLKEPFQIMIDSDLKPGSLTYGECLIPGRSSQEILISCYICHPSMANDSLSGVLLTAFLARQLKTMKNRFWSYRIVFVPETLGAITYCAANEEAMKKIDMGLVITTVGGPGKLGYKKSWQFDHSINRMIEEVMSEAEESFITYPFDIHGSDERQYSSQGFRINCATICKDRYYEYPEYHSSLDNLGFVTGEQINETLQIYLKLIGRMEQESSPCKLKREKEKTENKFSEKDLVYTNLYSHCEVMLSKHDLYSVAGGNWLPKEGQLSELDVILWLLFYCDGQSTLSEISRTINAPIDFLHKMANILESKGVLKRFNHG
jgi:aminopeptidase-like protein